MKKKISLLLLAMICIFTIVGCASQENDTESYDQDQLSAISDIMVDNFKVMGAEDFEYFITLPDKDLDGVMTSAGLPITGESFRGMIEAWQASAEECGEFVECSDYNMEISHDGIILSANAVFAEREAELQFIFNEELNLETMVVNPEYTIGEILTKAGLNTVLGMGTVFAVLIFIAFIISLFKYIPAIEEKFKKKPAQAEKVAAPVAAPVAPVATTPSDDTALIAVITAAIAASEGTSTDGFVVRSIRRRKSNKWNA